MKIIRLASKIRLWLDDERDPKNLEIQQKFGARGDEIWVKNVGEALSYIQTGNVEYISFDNDLGEGLKEGKELANWIEKEAYYKRLPRLSWEVHSQNPPAHKEIIQTMQNADKFWQEDNDVHKNEENKEYALSFPN